MTNQAKRIARLTELLRSPRDAPSLAKELQVTIKTLREDIVSMQKMGIPVITHRRKHNRQIYRLAGAPMPEKQEDDFTDFGVAPQGLEARQIIVCLKQNHWHKIEWLAEHLVCDTARAATILLTQAVMDLDISEVKRNHGVAMMEEARSKYEKD